MKSRKEKGGALKPVRKTDKKSSRGVMYENEGLRLRSIEINAEVERGQSDLRKLKRENETLKQQVWTLRDEYDKLESIVKEMEDETETDDGDEEDEESNEDEAKSKSSIPKIEVEEENVAENENLENLQKIYSGQVRSVEYTVRQGTSEVDPSLVHMHPHGCSHPNAPNIVQIHPPGDPPMLISQNSEIPSHSGAEVSMPQPDPYVAQTDHFNLDQLLDFASSFHYDRRKHLTEDDTTTLAVSLPKEEDCSITEEPEEVGEEEVKVSSPTPSSGFSTIRRRSSTVIEKLKSAQASAVIKELKQVSLCKDGVKSSGIAFSETPEVSNETTTVSYTRSSYYFAGSLDGRSQSLGTGLNSASSVKTPGTPEGPLYSSNSASNIASTGATSSSLDSCLPLVSIYSKRTPSLVRLSSIEPNTVMVAAAEMPQLWDITTQEIIDELERQVSNAMPDIRGVRVASRAAYISMGHRESLQLLMECGLTVRGALVPLIDITRESIIVALTGVPHYIADATLAILLSAFGTIIGELERRFYKGVDTGERFVRLKLKIHVKLPKYVTVGGCRIVLGVHGTERPIPQIQDWTSCSSSVPPSTPHAHITPRDKIPDFPPPLSQGSGSSERESADSVRIGVASGEAHYHKLPERRNSVSGPKTFASRCVVNLKMPERPGSALGSSRLAHREAPLPPPTNSGIAIGMGGTSSSINAGHVLRAGSLGRNPRSNSCEDKFPSQGGLSVPQVNIKSPIINRRNRLLPSLQEGRPKEQPRSRPSSVAFEDSPRELIRVPPPMPHVPPNALLSPPLANGILRKTSSSNSEQEALLPGPAHGPTATIRSRLKLGRSVSYDAGKQKQSEKEKKKKGSRGRKMESISENALNDDANSDVTLLSSSSRPGSRRDSEKSSVSSNGKSGNKPKKEVIDLPWCGCWGNGCF